MPAPRRFRHECETGHIAERRLVRREVTAPNSDAIVETSQLPSTYGSEQIAKSVVVADFGMFVVRSRFARLRCELLRVINERLVVGDKHPSTRCRNNFVPVEGKNASLASGARRPSLVT